VQRTVSEFGEAEAGLGFAFAGEKLLHQPFFMGLERVHFPRLRGHQLVHRTQALGDFLLFAVIARTGRPGSGFRSLI
jgi:hypothetical protein